jgi:predicted Rossmann fold nucleotide-binding protein DprA/Smf involved in DNA uptake
VGVSRQPNTAPRAVRVFVARLFGSAHSFPLPRPLARTLRCMTRGRGSGELWIRRKKTRSDADVDMHDEQLWPLLQAAGVPGRLRGLVMSLGPQEVWNAGQLRDGDKVRVFDTVLAEQRCARLAAFFAAGGRLLDHPTLDRLAAAGVGWLTGYARGPLWSWPAVTVAIVGARDAPERWLEAAFHLAKTAAQRGALVISGGARGVDRASHLGAIEGGGQTVAVVGEPAGVRAPTCVSVVGPHISVMTQHAPWVHHARGLHRSRNAAVTGLADLTIVVGGRLQSGTWGTVHDALRLGRRLAFVDGPEDDPFSAIAHHLHIDGRAHLVDPHNVEAWWQLLERAPSLPAPARQPTLFAPATTTMNDACPLLACLAHHGGKLLVDEVAHKLQRTMDGLMVDLAMLELDGSITRDGALVCLTRQPAQAGS